MKAEKFCVTPTGASISLMSRINRITHTQFMGCPSGGRGPSRVRGRNSTSGSGRRGRGEGVGAGVLDSENNGRIRRQPSLIGRLS